MLMWENTTHASNLLAQPSTSDMAVRPANNPSGPSLQHTCPRCSHTQQVPFSAAVFSQNLVCDNCTHLTQQGPYTPTPSAKEADDLAAAFARSVSLEHRPQLWAPSSSAFSDRGDGAQVHFLAAQPAVYPPPQPQQPQQPQIVYASMHYTHSAHCHQPVQQRVQDAAEPYMSDGYLQYDGVPGQRDGAQAQAVKDADGDMDMGA